MKNILCFGDSNTWGYIPGTGNRFSEGIRWTSILQNNLGYEYKILEEGLCGRTSVFDDRTRPDRNGIKSLPGILENAGDIDAAIIMLGTNDCKSYYDASAREIAEGVDKCVNEILKFVPAEKVIVVSPILLGEDVYLEGFDPEFNKKSVVVSKSLKHEYEKIALKRGTAFLAASDYVTASREDMEHMNALGHAMFAQVITGKLQAVLAGSLLKEKIKTA